MEVHDASSDTKNMTLDTGGIIGLHQFSNETIDFDPSSGVKDVIVRVGSATTVNISITPEEQSVTIDTQSQTSVSVQCLVKGKRVMTCCNNNTNVFVVL